MNIKIKDKEVTLPSMKKATILTSSQYEELYDYIPSFNDSKEPNDWFIQEDNGEILLVSNYEFISEVEGTGIRPVLIFSGGLLNLGLNLGDRFDIGLNSDFTVLSDTMAIYNSFIATEEYSFSELWYYENTEIKKKVDKWFDELSK